MDADADELRDYLMDYCGTAAFGVGAAAMFQMQEIESADDEGLFGIARDLGVDAERFGLEED
ncbi:MAG: hypothetical protein IKG22_01120 [Atopobiaceae bacterium]|nr:hypothetical protein [Atopobiaceae bacterium]